MISWGWLIPAFIVGEMLGIIAISIVRGGWKDK